jgi:hypothetical protein
MAKIEGAPDSATSQWFINLVDNSELLDNLDGGYTVFARVTNGMAVADAIGQLTVIPTSKHPELPVIGYTIEDFNKQKPLDEANLVMTDISADAAPPDPTFVMNPGLNDAWYNPATNGQGTVPILTCSHRQCRAL